MARVVAFLANGFETIEALTVIDLLRRAKISVDTVSVNEEKCVVSAQNIPVIADKSIDELDMAEAEMIILPGGGGYKRLLESEIVIENVKDFANKGKLLAAICAAPSILGKLGILKGKKATCFPGFEEQLEGAEFVPDKAVRDGNIITGKGMGASMEFGLMVIEALENKALADELAATTQFVI